MSNFSGQFWLPRLFCLVMVFSCFCDNSSAYSLNEADIGERDIELDSVPSDGSLPDFDAWVFPEGDAEAPDSNLPDCGNGLVEAGEACDDGEFNGQLGACTLSCEWPTFPLTPHPIGIDPSYLDAPPACTREDLFVKYLWYRFRFIGNGTAAYPGFIVLGTGAGEGIPASFRQDQANCQTDWSMSQCSQRIGKGQYAWGDATSWLGEWMAVLATEYKAFKLVGLDTASTEKALFYALNAFNRLDEAAEAAYGVEPARDGFFLRDDIPGDFMELPAGGARFPGYTCLKSDFSCGVLNIANGDYVSQDQILALIHGLALIYNLVPDGVEYDGMEFRPAVREIIHRMINHVRKNNWKVADPNGDHPPDAWGGNAIAFSSKLAHLANKVCGTAFGIDDYQTFSSQLEGEAVFMGLLAIWNQTHFYNRTMVLQIMATIDEWSPDEIAKWALKDSKESFAFHHALNNNTELSSLISLWRTHSLLATAPCGGPCHQTPNCSETDGWKGDSRLISPQDRMIDTHYSRAEFNGLDYMLLHNLYLIYRRGVYDYQSRVTESTLCDDYPSLKQYLQTGDFPTGTFDPEHSCTKPDMAERFCGRSWAAWLVDAYQGKATIFTYGKKWICEPGFPCRLDNNSSQEGTETADLFLGTPGNDTFYGLGGDDCLYGFDGMDTLYGGLGNDEIHGGPGADLIYGDDGHDTLYGEEGDDTIYGGPGRDEIIGGEGDDYLEGGPDDDFMNGGPGNDVLYGGPGDDVLLAGPGNDTLIGGDGDDRLYGEEGYNKIRGDGGNDTIDGGKGHYNFLMGGSGNDYFAAHGNFDIVCGGTGTDSMWGNWASTQKCRDIEDIKGNSCVENSATQAECLEAYFDYWTPPE